MRHIRFFLFATLLPLSPLREIVLRRLRVAAIRPYMARYGADAMLFSLLRYARTLFARLP